MNDPTNTQAPAPAPRRFIRIRDVMNRTGLSKSTIYAKIRQNQFPKYVPLGSISVWVEAEIDRWIDQQIFKRDEAA
ncbi:helix-turn-helix transcriptional regulator [Xanthomonas axonopodis]|uniref:helix-turn-helix transcriptional regulator n=1 Tax=Xanthomonas axonopodis TaxID=53413 RepID=UPI0035560FF8